MLLKPEQLRDQTRRTEEERLEANQEWYGVYKRPGWLTGMSEERRLELAELGRNDLHFLCVFILGYERLTTPDGIHGKMCRFAEGKIGTKHSGSGMRRMILIPRGHFKTTIFSIARNIQRVLQDPLSTHLIVSADEDLLQQQISAPMGKIIKDSAVFKFFYGDYIEPDPNDWALGHRSVKREGHEEISESTFEFRTIRQPTAGRHIDSITADDLVTIPNTRSQKVHEEVINYWRGLFPTMDTNDFLLVGTRYRDWDLYGYVKERHGDPEGQPDGFEDDSHHWDDTYDDEIEDWTETVEIWEEPLYVRDEETNRKLYIFPDEWGPKREKAARRQMGLTRFSCQYMNDPLPDERKRFRKDQFQYYNTLPETANYIVVDPASGEGSSNPAVVVGGIDENNNRYIIDAEDQLDSSQDIVNTVFGLAEQWNVLIVFIEVYSGGKVHRQNLEREMERRNFYLSLNELKTSGQVKEDRIIWSLEPVYNAGIIYHSKKLRDSDFEEQLCRFPEGSRDDLVDATAYLVEQTHDYRMQGKRDEMLEDQLMKHYRSLRHGSALTMDDLTAMTIHHIEMPGGQNDDTQVVL